MTRDPLSMFCYTDLAGITRGKGFPTRLSDKRLASGIAWTPTNLMFTALGTIAPSVWGPHGDLTLMPDPATGVEVDFADGSPAERFYLCDLRTTDGAVWECCPRSLLRDAVAELERETGVTLRATFEHEFVYEGADSRPSDMYALDAVRRDGGFGEAYLGALAAAGVEVDSYLPEFGPGQFELTVPPEDALSACDTAVTVRQMARATASRLGHDVTFSPRVSPEGLGSGLHIHFSLWDADGAPISHDPGRPHGVSETAGRFLAGIVRHYPALCAFTAPSPISYLRLVPHTWTGVWSNIGYRDREAGLRICPTFDTSGAPVAHQFNFEFRAADATANPYLQLAVILKAGLAGLRDGLEMPEPTVEADPETMRHEDRDARGIARLPASLDDALAAVEADATVRDFLPAPLLEAYFANKRDELSHARDWGPEKLCRRYSAIY